jgi:hypothetical protein
MAKISPEERAIWGKRILNLRAEAGIATQSAAASLVGMVHAQYADLEAGRRIPTLPTLCRFVVGWGLDASRAGEILFGPDVNAAKAP